ncbi:hypothetical protein PAI11_16920 [Patulibacter medicamentivorans]|uniref:DUF1385 domain-containing protein n=1 Tax=Patulibacter medicamentivorans TaxID=1097667 RepID=H0E4G1_9ACTN|nr:DUF1385 domain-containing protein [Patulibacter medicamentivorans]EHN11413.1 hypothetical protein PAI11_16920 [Patulibacter medicamentivorans]
MATSSSSRAPFDQNAAAGRASDTSYAAQQDAPVGGQAVIEGVMMRGVKTWAVAVRKPLPEQLVDGAMPAGVAAEGEIQVETFPFRSVLARRRLLRTPVLRGVVALVESLRIGFRALRLAANAQSGEDEPEIGAGSWIIAVLGGLGLAVGLFFLAPVGLTSLIKDQLGSGWLFWMVEGVVRTAIFIGYLVLVTRLADLRRVFEYHGAEHKTIACYEAGLPLTPENADRFSRLHPRCGTSFMLIVMIVAIFVFAPVGLPEWYWLFATRILGIPLIIGLSFEAIKFAGRHRGNPIVARLMWPGLQLQRLTTKPPDHDQLAVAIAALQAVLDREDPRAARGRDLVGIEVAA